MFSKVFKVLLVASYLLASLSYAQKESSDQKKMSSLSGPMRGLSQSLSQLMPLLVSDRRFNDLQNRAVIDSSIAALKTFGHQISSQKQMVNTDPSLKFLSRKLVEDMIVAESLLKTGYRHTARQLLSRVTNYCVACHSLSDQGSHDFNLVFEPNLTGFSKLEKAQYYASVRQFENALNQFDHALVDKKNRLSDSDWAEGAKKSLAIAIRVERRPHLALELVSRLMHAGTVPESMDKVVKQWRKAIKAWIKSEEAAGYKAPKSAAQKFNLALSVIDKAGLKSKAKEFNDQNLIHYLRASTLLHDVLKDVKDRRVYGQTLFYAGLVAESLREINLWTLHESYYEACIRYQPGTKWSGMCFDRLQASINKEAGKLLKDSQKQRMQELKKLAGS